MWDCVTSQIQHLHKHPSAQSSAQSREIATLSRAASHAQTSAGIAVFTQTLEELYATLVGPHASATLPQGITRN